MPELLIIVPSRGRPQNIARLLNRVHQLAELDTSVAIGIDEDDPALEEYKKVHSRIGHDGDILYIGPPKGLAEWTNHIAAQNSSNYPYLASLGDDHLPRTKGFDRRLVRAIKDMGGTGFSYPYGDIREDIPEAWFQSSDIVKALGWMMMPELSHFYVDNVTADLGRWAGCIRYCRAVAIDHLKPANGKAPVDDLYVANSRKVEADKDAYNEWRSYHMLEDARKIDALMENKTPAVMPESANPA